MFYCHIDLAWPGLCMAGEEHNLSSSPALNTGPGLCVKLKTHFLNASFREGRIRYQELEVDFILLGIRRLNVSMHMYEKVCELWR